MFRKTHVGICSPLGRINFRVSFGYINEDHLGCPRLTNTGGPPKINKEGFGTRSTKISQMRKARSERTKSGKTSSDESHERVGSAELLHFDLKAESMFIGNEETVNMLSVVVVFRRADSEKSVDTLHPRLSEFGEWRNKGRFKGERSETRSDKVDSSLEKFNNVVGHSRDATTSLRDEITAAKKSIEILERKESTGKF